MCKFRVLHFGTLIDTLRSNFGPSAGRVEAMKKRTNKAGSIFLAFFLVVMILSAACLFAADEARTFRGRINSDWQFEADDGSVYIIAADNRVGESLMAALGKKIEIKGSVGEKEGKRIILVKEFRELK